MIRSGVAWRKTTVANNCIIDFEVLVCKLICRKDTGCLLEQTILPRFTDGLEIIETFELHIFNDDECGVLVAKYHCHTGPIQNATPSHIPTNEVFVTGDLAFQAMALGKESMAGHWCMQCKATWQQFSDDCKLWTMNELVRCGKDAETKKRDPLLEVKKKPWWPFIPLDHYMVPFLRCEIGIGNQLLDWLQANINKHITCYSPGKEDLLTLIRAIKTIIAATAKERDDWDEYAEGGKKQKTLTRAVAAYLRQREIMLANINKEAKVTHRANESLLANLNLYCTCLLQKLKKACHTLSDQQLKLKVMQTAKGKKEHNVERKMFKMLKDIGVELSSYHGELLNGKDIKKVMKNATYFFDELAVIINAGNRPGSILSDAHVEALCLHFREVFVLWDGAFSLA